MGVKKVIGSQISDPCYRAKIRITQLLAEIWHTAYKSFYTKVSGCLRPHQQSSLPQIH